MKRLSQQKSYRGISLHRSAGRQHHEPRSYHYSPRPERRQQPYSPGWKSRKSPAKQHKLNKVRHQTSSTLETSRKRARELSPADPLMYQIIATTSDEETDSADEFHPTDYSPKSPAEHERGQQPPSYTPKSPVYHPPDCFSDVTESSSIPDLIDDLSAEDDLKQSEAAPQATPADLDADKDLFQDVERQEVLKQKLDKELQAAPWKADKSQQTLEKLETIASSVRPVYEEFLQKDTDIITRLNEAAKEMKDRSAETKKDPTPGASQQKDTVSTHDKCLACQGTVEQHLVKTNKEKPQQKLQPFFNSAA